jgi:hypothetical protein
MSDTVSLSQVFGVAVSVSIGVIGWFVKKIFAEMEKTEKRSRDNERDLYTKLAQTREEMLKMEIERLKSK